MRPWGIALALALAAGCGPVAYVHQVTMSADDEVDKARRADAEKFSPYWFTRATQYLHMAREVAAHADYQGANRFGRLAEEAAKKAQEEAEIGAENPSRLPYIDPKKAKDAPAKDAPAPAPATAPPKDAPKDAPAPTKDPEK